MFAAADNGAWRARALSGGTDKGCRVATRIEQQAGEAVGAGGTSRPSAPLLGVASRSQLFAEAVAQLLRSVGSPHVVEVGDDGVVARALDGPAAPRLDVLFVDTDGWSVEVVSLLSERLGSPRVILLSDRPAEGARLAQAAGAAGWLTKTVDVDELVAAVADALADRRVTEAGASTPPGRDRLALTRREQQVLALVARGDTNDRVGVELEISPATVRTHVQNILTKLGVSNRLEAAATARQEGLLR